MAFNFSFRKNSIDKRIPEESLDSRCEFIKSINLFSSKRKIRGLSLEDLSKKTMISKNVLIAIENGWEKYLPEKTYLISMIKSLEIKLNLERGSLNGLSIRKDRIDNISRFKFNFINIDFLNSWIGSLLYIFFMLLSILALNIQQKYLMKINSVSTDPIITEQTVINNGNKINNQKDK